MLRSRNRLEVLDYGHLGIGGFNNQVDGVQGAVGVRAARVYRMNGGEMIIDGSVTAAKINTADLAANSGFIADLTARIVKSEMFVGKEFFGGKFIGSYFWTDAAEAVGLKIDNQGLRVYGAEGGEPVTEIRADGGTVYSITNPTTGEVLAALDSEGGVTGQALSIAGESRLDGSVVTGSDPLTSGHGSGDYGVTMNGRDTLGATFMKYVEEHPNVADGNAWMTVIPHGIVAHQEVSTPNQGWNAVGGIDHARIRAVVTLDAVYGRMYQITYRTPAIKETSSMGGTIGGAAIVYSAPGKSISAGATTNNALTGSRYYLRGGGGFDQAMVTVYARCPEDIPEGKIMLGRKCTSTPGAQQSPPIPTTRPAGPSSSPTWGSAAPHTPAATSTRTSKARRRRLFQHQTRIRCGSTPTPSTPPGGRPTPATALKRRTPRTAEPPRRGALLTHLATV